MSALNIVNMVGGLGNQMFQYLFGRTLEIRSGVPTRYDISDFDSYARHEGLAIETYFDVALPLLDAVDVPVTPWLTRGYIRKRVISRLARYLGPFSPVSTDNSFSLDDCGILQPRGRYFRGYWQSQPYADKDIATVIQELNFREKVQRAAGVAIAKLEVKFPKVAAVQIRRGDYMKLPKHSPLYGLPLDYYYRAMDNLNKKLGVETFYIFSDDIEEIKEVFRCNHEVVFVDETVSGSVGVDLCMMAAFDHIIISNSTFGWWAAALGGARAGTVTAPTPWINPSYRGESAVSVRLFDEWETVEVYPVTQAPETVASSF